MQLSLQADYSCRVLIYLAHNQGRCSIDDVAKAYGISKNHLIKVAHLLGKEKFIETTRGRGGGIQLLGDPTSINIGQVIRKTETNLAIAECMNKRTNTCPIIRACGLKPWLAEATEAFLNVLDKLSLADIMGDPSQIKQSLSIPRN